MEVSPILLATVGEIALIFLAVLIFSLRRLYLASRSLKAMKLEHHDLLEKHDKISEQKHGLEQLQKQDSTADLLRETVALIHERYTDSGHDDLNSSDNINFNPDADTASLVLAYQVLIAQLNAIDNNKNAEMAWGNIDEHLQAVIGGLFNKESAADETITALEERITEQSQQIEALEQSTTDIRAPEENMQNIDALERTIAEQNEKIATLEKSKGQPLTEADAEQFCTQIGELAEKQAMDDIQIVTKAFASKIVQGEVTTNKSDSQPSRSPGTDLLHQGLKNSEDEIETLRQKISSQHETIRDLELQMTNPSEDDSSEQDIHTHLDTIKQNLKDSEMCIETMDMEIESAHKEIALLASELEELKNKSITNDEQANMIQNFASDTKQLLDCISVLEETSKAQQNEISELAEKLEASESERHALEEKSTAPQGATLEPEE